MQRHGSIIIAVECPEKAVALIPITAFFPRDVRLIETVEGKSANSFQALISEPKNVSICSIEILKTAMLSLRSSSESCRCAVFIICGNSAALRGSTVSSICSELLVWPSDLVCVCVGPIPSDMSDGNLSSEVAALVQCTRCTTDVLAPSIHIEPSRKTVFVCHKQHLESSLLRETSTKMDIEFDENNQRLFSRDMNHVLAELMATRSRVQERRTSTSGTEVSRTTILLFAFKFENISLGNAMGNMCSRIRYCSSSYQSSARIGESLRLHVCGALVAEGNEQHQEIDSV